VLTKNERRMFRDLINTIDKFGMIMSFEDIVNVSQLSKSQIYRYLNKMHNFKLIDVIIFEKKKIAVLQQKGLHFIDSEKCIRSYSINKLIKASRDVKFYSENDFRYYDSSFRAFKLYIFLSEIARFLDVEKIGDFNKLKRDSEVLEPLIQNSKLEKDYYDSFRLNVNDAHYHSNFVDDRRFDVDVYFIAKRGKRKNDEIAKPIIDLLEYIESDLLVLNRMDLSIVYNVYFESDLNESHVELEKEINRIIYGKRKSTNQYSLKLKINCLNMKF